LPLFFLVLTPVTGRAQNAAAAPAQAACSDCHADFSTLLPKNHPPAQNNLTACIGCHPPDLSGKAEKNAFSTRIHLAHLGAKAELECTGCHSWTPGGDFGLIGQKLSWGPVTKDDMALMKQEFASWKGPGFLDNLHAKAMVDCSGCHGKEAPKPDATVENSRCLACHGPLEKLAEKSTPKEFANRNPHKSHLGDINCTVCHHGHSASTVYCGECHRNFNMKIPAGEASQ
jgi:hypothetical protein